jgi:hypothetical protein
VAAAAQESLPVPVFFTYVETPPLPPLTPQQHEAAARQTREAMFELAARLRKEHGDKTSAWPADVWETFHAAEDAHTFAVARRHYQPRETLLALGDSVEDVLRNRGNKYMTPVTSADQAALIVQITGRRRITRTDPLENGYFIRFRIAPGPAMSMDRFLELTRGYNWNGPFLKLISRARTGTPYVDLEAGSPVSYRNCATGGVFGTVMRLIADRFAKPQ